MFIQLILIHQIKNLTYSNTKFYQTVLQEKWCLKIAIINHTWMDELYSGSWTLGS